METRSALLALCEGIHRTPGASNMQNVDVFFVFNLNKLFNKQSSCRYLATWFSYDVTVIFFISCRCSFYGLLLTMTSFQEHFWVNHKHDDRLPVTGVLWQYDDLWRHRFWSTLTQEWLVAWRHQAIAEPMLTYRQQGPVAFIWVHNHKKVRRHQSAKQYRNLHV